MKSRIYLIFLFILTCTGIVLLYSQDTNDTTSEKELTIEELYLQNPEILTIREQAFSSDPQTMLQSLDGIDNMVDDGAADKNIEDILIFLASQGTSSQTYVGKTLVNNFPEIRRRACNALGKLGKNEVEDEFLRERAKDTLIGILYDDIEPMVKSEAAYALGIIGHDDDGRVVRALANSIETQSIVNPDDNFAFAVILALEKLYVKNDGLADSAGYRALIKIAQGNYIQHVKQKAYNSLISMKDKN